MLQAGRSRDRDPMRSLSFFIELILPAALDLGIYSASNRVSNTEKEKFPGSKARPVRKADKLTYICEPIVQTMWDPLHLTTL
jgi:hypothetical protein